MLFLAVMCCAVLMPCLVVFWVIFSRLSDNPFDRIIGRCTLSIAVLANAIGQMVLEEPLVYTWPEPLPSWPVFAQLLVGVAGIGIGLSGLPAANRSFDDLARSVIRDLRRTK